MAVVSTVVEEELEVSAAQLTANLREDVPSWGGLNDDLEAFLTKAAFYVVGHDGGEEALEVSLPVPIEDGHHHPTGGRFGRRAAARLHHLGLKKRSSGSSRL